MNRRLLIPLGIGLVILIAWFLLLYSPQSKALADARKRTNQATQQGATLRDQLTRLQQSRRDQPLKQSQLETLRVAVPDEPNLAQFILDANDAASKAGIDFLSITPTPPAAGQGATTPAAGGAAAGGAAATAAPIRIAMTATGGYFQVLDFVNRLNRLPRIVVVDTLQMGGQGAGAQLQVSMQERIFTTSARPVAGAAGGGGAATTGSSTTTTAPGGTTTTTRPGGG